MLIEKTDEDKLVDVKAYHAARALREMDEVELKQAMRDEDTALRVVLCTEKEEK